jgi:hypothetical protein
MAVGHFNTVFEGKGEQASDIVKVDEEIDKIHSSKSAKNALKRKRRSHFGETNLH